MLFLDPSDGKFYSYCASRGLLVLEENVPNKIAEEAENQIEDLKACLEI